MKKKLASLNWPLFIGPSLALRVWKYIVGLVQSILDLDKSGRESIGISVLSSLLLASRLVASCLVASFYLTSSLGSPKFFLSAIFYFDSI